MTWAEHVAEMKAELPRLTTENAALRIQCAGLGDRIDDLTERYEADLRERDVEIARLRAAMRSRHAPAAPADETDAVIEACPI